MTLLAKRYATALHALAVEQGVVDAVGRDLAAIDAVLTADGVRPLITSPDVTEAERGVVLGKLGEGRHELVRNLLGVLQHRRRLDVLFDLHDAFRTLAMAARGEVEGVVETAHPLDAAELDALTRLAGRLSGKNVQLTVAIRPELLGGARLRIGNVLYDGSLRATLDQLEARLQQATV